jgi:hypothetical protein
MEIRADRALNLAEQLQAQACRVQDQHSRSLTPKTTAQVALNYLILGPRQVAGIKTGYL